MLVQRTLSAPTAPVWYLAYGSNMAHSKFVKDRGLIPLDSAVVRVPGYSLRMNSAGFPYREPAFASISPITTTNDPHHSDGEKGTQKARRRKEPELVGVAYLITPEQYARMLASEGGGIAYREAAVRAVGVGAADDRKLAGAPVRSLVTVLENEARPSARYMGLLTAGAAEMDLPREYRDYLAALPAYEPPERGYRRVGAAIFSAIWVPIMQVMEFVTKKLVGTDGEGHSPFYVVALVRLAVWAMWFHHGLHAVIWGRGDGMDQERAERRLEGERAPLLERDREKDAPWSYV